MGLLDLGYGTARVAYSTRLLRDAYAGSCVNVRAATDADIGFSSGWIDESALATHCGVSAGYINTWYDQSTNADNATQSTDNNQPRIYSGSATDKATAGDQSGATARPTLLFDEHVGGNENYLTASLSESWSSFAVTMVCERLGANITGSYSVFGFLGVNYTTNTNYWMLTSDLTATPTSFGVYPGNAGSTVYALMRNEALPLLTNVLSCTGGAHNSNTHELWWRGVQIAESTRVYTNSGTNLFIGAWNSNGANINVSEFIVWDGYPDLYSIQKNQMDAFEMKYPGFDATGGVSRRIPKVIGA